jgi:OOP family OmpA-OmpF porin
VNAVIAAKKITFTPASAELATDARPVLDALAGILVACPPMQMEIAGHTDAQGSEGGNRALSQARAEAVLLALQGRRVDISGMTAVGYGEATPIADNDSEAGREANRRIEFVLKGVGETLVVPGEADAGEAPSEQPAAPADAAGPATERAAAEGQATEAGQEAGGTPAPEPDAASGTAAPDFSGDTSPSVAPTEKTIRPLPRPEDLAAEGSP